MKLMFSSTHIYFFRLIFYRIFFGMDIIEEALFYFDVIKIVNYNDLLFLQHTQIFLFLFLWKLWLLILDFLFFELFFSLFHHNQLHIRSYVAVNSVWLSSIISSKEMKIYLPCNKSYFFLFVENYNCFSVFFLLSSISLSCFRLIYISAFIFYLFIDYGKMLKYITIDNSS